MCTRSVSVNCSQCSSAATWPSLQCCFQLPLITAWVQIWVCHLQFDVRRWVFPSIGGSPVRYIDIEYRLSIYRHFWKISISTWSFLKISISISIFTKISLSISISIFFRFALSVSISIFSKMTTSISIFFKSVDISTIDIRYRYIEQAYLTGKTSLFVKEVQTAGTFHPR